MTLLLPVNQNKITYYIFHKLSYMSSGVVYGLSVNVSAGLVVPVLISLNYTVYYILYLVIVFD